ncbi:MAG: hypothetical protein ABFD12_12455 [Syntrophorhabdus sp.]
MPQHDFEITNADANTGIPMRAQINAAFQALASLSSGAAEPVTPYACQPWADTANDLLKIRNSDNTAWITIGTLSSTYLGLASLAVANDFTASQKLDGDALLLRLSDTGVSGAEWAIRSDGALLEIVKNTGTEVSPTWTVQASFDVNALRLGDGTAADIRLIANNAAATKPEIRYQNSSSRWQYSDDGENFSDLGLEAGCIPVRQTVLSAAVDANGYPNFISIGSGLAVNIDGLPTPIRIAFAAGFEDGGALNYIGKIASDTSISSLYANRTNYLYAERNPSTGAITLGKTYTPPAYLNAVAASLLIGPNIGTAIGNMTQNGGLAAGFDNVISQGYGSAAAQTYGTSSIGYIGKDWGSGIKRTISKFILYGTPDTGFLYNISDFTVKLQGSDNNTDWTDLYTSATITNSTSLIITVDSGITVTNPYRYHRIALIPATDCVSYYIAEVQLFQVAQHVFVVPEMKMYEYDGTWTEKQLVFLGEAATDGSSVTSVVNYALRGKYDSGETVTTAASTSKNHNIGVDSVKATLLEGWPGARYQIMSKDFSSITRNSITWTAVAGSSRLLVERGF